MTSSMKLHGKNDIQSAKSDWSILHSELESHILTLLEETIKDIKGAHIRVQKSFMFGKFSINFATLQPDSTFLQELN